MDIIFDIVGSFIIRAAITVISLNLMMMMNDSLFIATEQSYLNDIIAVPAEVMTYDLRLAGYKASKKFLIAKKQEVKFCADADSNTFADTVRYYLGTPDAVTHHQLLYRTINGGTPYNLSNLVDTLSFTYFDSLGRIIQYDTSVSIVKSIFVQLRLESEKVIPTVLSGSNDTLKLKSFWENHIFPKNL